MPIGTKTIAGTKKATVFAEWEALEKNGRDLSEPGFNQAVADKHGVSLRSVEGWKKEYKQQKNTTRAASGAG
ncbi:hypothetical protein FDN03_16175 [Glutamicibacter sp. V16R2B1]|nr:hypothetical protein FDN03_16175 [Glutamicibacter sp. V16R2B1]